MNSASCETEGTPQTRDTGPANWGPAHRRWLAAVVCRTPAPQIVLQAYGRAVTAHTARLGRLDHARPAPATAWRVHPVVAALQARRGVQFTVAVTTVAALGAHTRGANPRQLLKCFGLIPAADASGARRRPGTRTTAGHAHARRALVAGAWASRDPATVSRHVQRRLAQQPTAIQDLSGKAPVRLCTRVRRLLARGKQATHVVVAMARDLVGLRWAMAQQVPGTLSVQPPPRGSINRGQSRSATSRARCRDDTGHGVGGRRYGSSPHGIRAMGGMLPPVVRPWGHRPQGGLHEPSGWCCASRPHAIPTAWCRAGTGRPARSGHRRETEVKARRPEQLARFAPSIGSGAAPVWCHPRRREEAARTPRASSEAGTGRRPVRWDPTHEDQPAQPPNVTGSASFDGPLDQQDMSLQKTDENFYAGS
jgi:Transposase IS116/IS110/IS902 family